MSVYRRQSASVAIAVFLFSVIGCRDARQSGDSGNRGKSPETVSTPPANRTQPLFEDATKALGVRFVHDSAARGAYQMWEQAGSGVAVADFNGDGRMDLFFVQCAPTNSPETSRLFLQVPDSGFLDKTAEFNAGVSGLGMGAAAADLNNDGWTDLMVTSYGVTHILMNESGKSFRSHAAGSGLENPGWGTAISCIDYDRDGWLDVVVANYLDYHETRHCRDATGRPEFCGPQDFSGTVTRLFRNLGGGGSGVSFRDVTIESGLGRHPGPGLGLYCADWNDDGWQDIFVTDDGKPNRLFIHQGNGRFQEEAARRGIAYNAWGGTAANMGIAAADLDGNGLLDVFVTHLATEQHTLWTQYQPGFFEDRTTVAGLASPRWRGTGFGTVAGDFDLDGHIDLAFVNGRVIREGPGGLADPETPEIWRPYAQRNQIFMGVENGRFTDGSTDSDPFCATASVGRGLASVDLDNDGDLDLVTVSAGGPGRIFRNVARRRGHWLTLRCVLPNAGGRDAIGAKVTIRPGTHPRTAVVQPSASYLSSHDPRLHFGLGGTEEVKDIRVVWPDGIAEEFDGGPVDRIRVLERGKGRSL